MTPSELRAGLPTWFSLHPSASDLVILHATERMMAGRSPAADNFRRRVAQWCGRGQRIPPLGAGTQQRLADHEERPMRMFLKYARLRPADRLRARLRDEIPDLGPTADTAALCYATHRRLAERTTAAENFRRRLCVWLDLDPSATDAGAALEAVAEHLAANPPDHKETA